ncbi:MAG: flagellar FliJ family protein [Buchnera aphidicola (Floraphis choui)]
MLNKKKIQEQVNLLSKYRNEYLVKLNHETSCGISGFELKNYDCFISSLINGIKNQRQTIKQYEEQYKKYFILWKNNQHRLYMWKTISMKLLQYDFKIMQLEEQLQIDEYVQKSFFERK